MAARAVRSTYSSPTSWAVTLDHSTRPSAPSEPCASSKRAAGMRSWSVASRTWSRPPLKAVFATKPPTRAASARSAATAGSSESTSTLASPVRISMGP